MLVFLAGVGPCYTPPIALPNRALLPLAVIRPGKTIIDIY